MRFTSVLFTIGVLFSTNSFAVDFKNCPRSAKDKLHGFESHYDTNPAPTYFVGLWSKLDRSEKPRLSKAVRGQDLSGVVELQNEMAARLLKDRKALIKWIKENKLESQILVSDIPENGTFTLFNATYNGILKVLCSASVGELPSIFSNPGI
jgi:hypothetical protein